MIGRRAIIFVVNLSMATAFLFSCQDEEVTLEPVESRVKNAIDNLRKDLIAPADGWRLDYRPTPDAGSFFMLLKFTADGQVTIQSDVPDDGGRYFEETIPYRIDNALGIELIFETYGVFHYLFELDQATFGAEFEFSYLQKDGDDLLFESISDFTDPTVIRLTPAAASDEASFSRTVATNLDAFTSLTPIIFGGFPAQQQIILQDANVSLFWSLDTRRRNVSAELASPGITAHTTITNGAIELDVQTGYSLRDGKIILDTPINFNLNNNSYSLSEIALTNLSNTAPNICATSATDDAPEYSGQATGLGNAIMRGSLYSKRGTGFQANVYSVNVDFVFDGSGNSLATNGSIGAKFPTASGFVFFYGVPLLDPNTPIYSVGLILEDGEVYVREFTATATMTNRVDVSLLDNYYYSGTTPPGTDQDLKEITDEIFAGGQVYVFDLPVTGLTVWRFFNPCNKYEVFLVE